MPFSTYLTCFGHTVCVGFQHPVTGNCTCDAHPKIKPPSHQVPTVFDTPPAIPCQWPKVLRRAHSNVSESRATALFFTLAAA